MKIQLIDDISPRSDGVPGGPSGVTFGKVYIVAENIPESDKYSIINDQFKMARYSKNRFIVVDNSPVPPLRDNFNKLTTELRILISELKGEFIHQKVSK